MNDLKNELRLYAPGIALATLIPHSRLAILRRTVVGVTALLTIALATFIIRDSVAAHQLVFGAVLTDARTITGLICVLLGPVAALYQITFFYNSLYYRGTYAVNAEDFDDVRGITFDVAKIIAYREHDLTASFLLSDFGNLVLFRAGVELVDTVTYLKGPRRPIPAETLPLQNGVFLTLRDVGEFLITEDASFKEFLFKHGVSDDAFRGALAWISRLETEARYRERWWSRDNLGKIPAIGGEFSYGVAYELKRYMRNINTTAVLSLVSNDSAYAQELITKIETILTRKRAANVMLIAEPGVGEMDLLIELGKRMRAGKSVSSILGKQLAVFDTDSFSVTHSSKQTFEQAFLELMSGAEQAGNIILIIEDFPSFLRNAETLGVDVGDLLGRFLTSSYIQIIATTDTGNWHQYLEQRGELVQEFQTVTIEQTDLGSTIRVLEDALWTYEHSHKIFFTYPSLVRIAESAHQYIVDGVMPDKALNLLAEVAANAHTAHHMRVTQDFVDACVSARTGIPVGPVQEEERELLIHLEDRLHERVVGQADAIKVIASTMRRSRAGIQDTKRPIGSFLFLGSTGVGKTETAKALAHVFFGSEENMLRFDMSEFSDASGLARLIGDKDAQGILATTLREQPYGVLLLDEFEKASGEVHDLFLQVLDEGFFTDASGRRVNARNSIIIATSNAGSDRIWEIVRRGERPASAKDAIISAIIRDAIFKPELINRFDSVVIFESLSPLQQRKIAEIMLIELKERIKRRGFELVVNEALIEAVSREGSDPEFGARPMRRAIQDIIEEKIALRILDKRLQPGDVIELSAADLV